MCMLWTKASLVMLPFCSARWITLLLSVTALSWSCVMPTRASTSDEFPHRWCIPSRAAMSRCVPPPLRWLMFASEPLCLCPCPQPTWVLEADVYSYRGCADSPAVSNLNTLSCRVTSTWGTVRTWSPMAYHCWALCLLMKRGFLSEYVADFDSFSWISCHIVNPAASALLAFVLMFSAWYIRLGLCFA